MTQVVASLDTAAAGPSYSVPRLAEALGKRGVDAALLCTRSAIRETPPYPGEQNYACWGGSLPVIRKLYLSPGLVRAVNQAAAAGAVLHSHGLWTAPNLATAWAARRHGAPHVVSPRGMLGAAALEFSRRRKQWVWWLAQHQALQDATCLHATSLQECEEIRRLGLRRPVAIVPNGIDIPSVDKLAPGRARGDADNRVLLHLGRIHPKKGIDRLVEAWARVEPSFPAWRLRIVGPSENGHAENMQKRAAALGTTRISFEPPLFGPEKDKAYRQAELFVLPTLNENFGLVVAEALANGTAVISTKGAPWAGLSTHRCGWWIDHGVQALEATLRQAMALPASELQAMGQRGREWMSADFSWERVAADLHTVYQWCLSGGTPPDCVETMR